MPAFVYLCCKSLCFLISSTDVATAANRRRGLANFFFCSPLFYEKLLRQFSASVQELNSATVLSQKVRLIKQITTNRKWGKNWPFLWWLTHRKCFVLVEAPHGKPVQRLVSTAWHNIRHINHMQTMTVLPRSCTFPPEVCDLESPPGLHRVQSSFKSSWLLPTY